MTGIIKPNQAPLIDLFKSKLDPISVEFLHMGLGAILIAVAPAHKITHCTFSSPPETLENDLTRISEYYIAHAARLQVEAIKGGITNRLKAN